MPRSSFFALIFPPSRNISSTMTAATLNSETMIMIIIPQTEDFSSPKT